MRNAKQLLIGRIVSSETKFQTAWRISGVGGRLGFQIGSRGRGKQLVDWLIVLSSKLLFFLIWMLRLYTSSNFYFIMAFKAEGEQNNNYYYNLLGLPTDKYSAHPFPCVVSSNPCQDSMRKILLSLTDKEMESQSSKKPPITTWTAWKKMGSQCSFMGFPNQ